MGGCDVYIGMQGGDPAATGENDMKRLVKITLFFSALALGAAVAGAAGDPIKERKDLMKTAGKSAGIVGKMLKGAIEYDAAKAEAAMKALAAVPDKFVKLFPEGSLEDPFSESKYSAKEDVWKNNKDFLHDTEELKKYALAAADAASEGKGAFGAAVKKVFGECKECHENFRMKR